MTKERAQWGSRVGLILAMAGNAVGLGNFLRFPRQAVQNGGGTFMIPYFIAFLLVGIPLMWIEWGVGRHGGLKGHGSVPGMFHSMWKHPVSKYLGVLGLFMPLVVLIYYCYIESWTLAWTWFSLTGATRGLDEPGMRAFLQSYQDLGNHSVHGFWTPFWFFFITIGINFAVVMKGLSGGIEKLAKIGMPILFVFAAILVIRVLTLHPQTMVLADGTTGTFGPMDGLNFMYTPDWAKLADAKVWLAAAGQIFFTLSVGMGTLQAYASYLRRSDDLTLSGIATAATNETAEVVLGGSLAIPAVVTFFGVTGAVAIAKGGAYDLGFVSMPLVFNKLPGGALMASAAGFMWFGLLFFAGITSSVSMATPTTSFLEENFAFTRKKAVFTVAGLAIGVGLLHIVFYTGGFLEEWDYWAGTFGLVIVALLETILFVWVLGPSPWRWREVWSADNKMWNELHDGAAWQIPGIYKFIMTYITPVFLVVMMVWWSYSEAYPILKMSDIDPAQHVTRWWSRGVMLLILASLMILTRIAWSRRAARGEEV
jgi:neurotransmitter:Na+ symporter, NSS family